jgi:hypothetical protein
MGTPVRCDYLATSGMSTFSDVLVRPDRSFGLSEIMTNLFFVFNDHVEFLQDLQQVIGILCLEQYSDHECSLLLGCARREVLPARTRVLEEIGRQVEIQDRQLSRINAQDSGLHHGPGSSIELMAVPPL